MKKIFVFAAVAVISLMCVNAQKRLSEAGASAGSAPSQSSSFSNGKT